MRTKIALLMVLVVLAARADAVEVPVFIVAGQSNAVGAATDANLLSSSLKAVQPNVLYAGSQELPVNWASLQPPTQTEFSTHCFGPELMLGKTISDARGGQQVAEVKFAVNGVPISTWDPAVAGSNYSKMLTRVNGALSLLPTQQPGTTGKVAGFFWMQGEGDAGGLRTTAQYQADLTNFISHLRTDFGDPNLPFVFGLIDNAGPGTDAIRQAQFNVAATVPHTFLFNTDSCQRVTATEAEPWANIHFDNQGMLDLGIGFGNGYLSIVPEPSPLGLAGTGLLASTGYLWRKRRLAAAPHAGWAAYRTTTYVSASYGLPAHRYSRQIIHSNLMRKD